MRINIHLGYLQSLTLWPLFILFKDIHGYLALCICIVGSLTNILNVVILTRKEMINSTNTILMGLAIVDFLLLVEYIGFAYSYVMGKENFLHYYSHAIYVLFHANFTQVTIRSN